MWVRSQDKTLLISCNNFSIECYANSKTNITSFDIETIESPNGKFTTLGNYSTKEKALKVLDMIEQFINCSEEYKAQGEYKREIVSGCNEINRLKTFVFQMPQDEDL